LNQLPLLKRHVIEWLVEPSNDHYQVGRAEIMLTKNSTE